VEDFRGVPRSADYKPEDEPREDPAATPRPAHAEDADLVPDSGETTPPQGDPLAEHVAGEAESPGTQEPVGAPRERSIATREYYSISEVCDLVGLKPHVLRYWETQFPVMNPSKNRSGNRVYQRKEIKLILLVKHLLYKEKYTIDGAKQRLEQLRRGGELLTETSRALDTQMIDLLRAELHQALQFLTVDPV
jgi:DNA-binding transcriptional MerR regulator